MKWGQQAGSRRSFGRHHPLVTWEFMYKVLWKKLVVRERVGLVKHID